MKTMTFTPHPDLDRLDENTVSRWASALRTSNQHKGSMANDDDTAHCCLCVLLRVEGASFADYRGRYKPSGVDRCRERFCNSLKAEKIRAANVNGLGSLRFAELNDDFLTHPQIAGLLEGKTVTIEVPA